jgi:Lipocalin-like domain
MPDIVMPDIVGTWGLVAAIARDAAGNVLPTPYGPQGMGRVTFNADGRMMAVLCDGRPSLPPGTTRDYGSYCGNYSFDGSTLITRVDAASDPARIGTDQVRDVRFEGARMILRPPPRQGASGTEQRELTWERIATV